MHLTKEDESAFKAIEHLKQEIKELEEKIVRCEQKIKELRAKEDLEQKIFFAQEIFQLQQEKLVLTTEVLFRQNKIKRLQFATDQEAKE